MAKDSEYSSHDVIAHPYQSHLVDSTLSCLILDGRLQWVAMNRLPDTGGRMDGTDPG